MTPDERLALLASAPDVFFHETLSGGMSWGDTEPLRGAARGRRTPLTFHATALIDDVVAFIERPEHTARLVARISSPVFGPEALAVEHGCFNLFRPGDAPRVRLMTYALPFSHAGRAWLLSGTKTLHDDRGWDLWHDTTRLFCQLHEGEDERGKVVAAGVLSMGVSQVLELIASMGSCRPGVAGLQARLRFGHFFLGGLWDLYAPRVRAAERPGPAEPLLP
ncbi:hypothetical protein [Archangium primigenium]|uniref:hypothetical protein n=1 Tax=Melittangium TaxID=44 RepID=UPI001959A006|nr:hypothetical protein [Archangium primigenium]MBM7116012.1 hypothetical protein [Archangium primigenium]